MIAINVNGVARPASPKIPTARTLTEAVKRARSGEESGKAQKVPVAVVKGVR